MLPHSKLKEMAGPARPTERCPVTHIVRGHKALHCLPRTFRIPEDARRRVCMALSWRHWSYRTGYPQRGVRASPRETHMEFWPSCCTPQEMYTSPRTGVVISRLTTGDKTFTSVNLSFLTRNLRGLDLRSVRIPPFSKCHEPVSSYSFWGSAQYPAQPLAITEVLSNMCCWIKEQGIKGWKLCACHE